MTEMQHKILAAIKAIMSGLALFFALTEVAWPWSLLAFLLAYIFYKFSKLAWLYVLFAKNLSALPMIVFHFLGAILFLYLIVLIPGPNPTGLLSVTSAGAFYIASLRKSGIK